MAAFDILPKNCLLLGSSPQFAIYENDFGWGRPVGIASGGNKEFDGMVSAHPSREGDGGVDLEICLPPPIMSAFAFGN
ncbi:hypothetical protein SUGI_0872540 [Cryptomeria japonica]|nr:hypothetical protein SUGI_0872540 [Cryptomeria japonica]